MSNLKRTAYHETGHTLVSFYHGLAIKKITIIPDEKTLGTVEGGKLPQEDLDCYVESRSKRWIEKEIQSFMAGYTAEKMYFKKGSIQGSQSDYSRAVTLAGCICGSNEEIGALLELCRIRAKNILTAYNELLPVFANALLEKKEMTGRTARIIIREAIINLSRPGRGT